MRTFSPWAGLVLSLLAAAPVSAAPPYAVTFVIDMREELAAKRFDPAKDKVGLRGGVRPLGWDVTLPAVDPDGDGRYEVRVSFPERPFGGQPVNYKFKVDFPGRPDDGWEDGLNRLLSLSTSRQAVERRFNEPPPPLQPTYSGNIRQHPGFGSKLVAPRDVSVYLPPGYDRETSRRYPVLYMQDGQNVFDATHQGMEWQMDETAERLISAGRIEPVIIVGVANTEARTDEYTPAYVEWKRPDGTVLKGGGKADLYGRFLIEELKPFVDATYRTLPDERHTALGGASHGGLVSLYLGLRHPDVFGSLLVVSPSAWWGDDFVIKAVRALPERPPLRIWLDMGTGEGETMLGGARRLRAALLAKGWKPGPGFHYLEQKGAQHDETAWAARVEPMLRFLYGK